MRKAQKGFTLIELMIVVAIIAIIAAIAIPSLLRSRLSANETSAQSTLRTIVTAQAQLKSNAWIDENNNGVGEYGTLGQLAGLDPCVSEAGEVTVNPPYIAAVLGIVPDDMDFPVRSGYHFWIFLDEDAVRNREQIFVAYAWPQERATTGNRAFVVSQEGTVYGTLGMGTGYTGGDEVPDFDSAFIENELNPTAWLGRMPVATNGETGNDGNIWNVTGD